MTEPANDETLASFSAIGWLPTPLGLSVCSSPTLSSLSSLSATPSLESLPSCLLELDQTIKAARKDPDTALSDRGHPLNNNDSILQSHTSAKRALASKNSDMTDAGKPRASAQATTAQRRTRAVATQSHLASHNSRRRPPMTTLLRDVEALKSKNATLRHQKWTLENQVTSLRAALLTGQDTVACTEALERRLEHARRHIKALQKQVRALGGCVLVVREDSVNGTVEAVDGSGNCGGDNEDVDMDDGEDKNDNDDDGDDGELPVSYPKAAACPQDYTLSAMRRRRLLHRKMKA